MTKVVELIVLAIGVMIYFDGFQGAVVATLANATGGGAIGTAMGTILAIVPYLVFIFIGIQVAFPGVLGRK